MVNVGESIVVCDQQYVDHVALVTAIHGWTTYEQRDAYVIEQTALAESQLASQAITQEFYDQWMNELADVAANFEPQPINAVYVNGDPNIQDPYGLRLRRLLSLPHQYAAHNQAPFYRL